MMLVEDNLVSLVNSRNQKMKMIGLSIQQHITNSIIKTEIVQKFEFEDSFYVLFKDNPNRKKLKILLGEKLLKSRLEEKTIFVQKENVITFSDQKFAKFHNYKVIELTKVPHPQGEMQEITISFCEIGKVLSKYSLLYYNIIRTFSKEILQDLKNYNLNIYLSTTTPLDFVKVYTKADTKIDFYNQKRNASISQLNQKTMEDLILYYRHEGINQPQISFGKEKERQHIIMIDYLPPFNPVKDFRQLLKSKNTLNSTSQDSDQEFSLESVEFCIVMDTSSLNPQRKFDCMQMQYLLNQALSKIEKTITEKVDLQETYRFDGDIQQKQLNYINFSFLDKQGWRQQYFKIKENTVQEHLVIKNQISPKIEWKNESSDLQLFLDDFTKTNNSLNLPKILFLITQGQWEKFDESVEQLKELKNCIKQNRNYRSLNQADSSQNLNNNEKSEKGTCNVADIFVLYYGQDSYGQERIQSAVSSERFFTRNTIDTPAFPQQDLFYTKKHYNFYLDIQNRENIEFSTIPFQTKNHDYQNNISVKYNEIFQQFIFLQPDKTSIEGNMVFLEGRTRQQCVIPIDFSTRKKKEKSEQILEQSDVAIYGLMKLFQSDEFTEIKEIMKDLSIQNHIHSPISQEVFIINDYVNGNCSSDASVAEIPTIAALVKPTQLKNFSFAPTRIPSIVKYQEVKSEPPKLAAITASSSISQFPKLQNEYKNKELNLDFPSKKKEEREKKINEKSEKKNNQKLFQDLKQEKQAKILKHLLEKQEQSGEWKFNEVLLQMLDYTKSDFYLLKKKISPEQNIDSLVMTSIILIEFKMRFSKQFIIWEPSQLKSTNWIDQNYPSSLYVKAFKCAREYHEQKFNKE